MQNLKTLNSLLLKETVDLREQIRQLRSKHAAVSPDRRIEEGIERGVCGVVVSSHLASNAEGCAALLRKAEDDLDAEKAAAAETTASLAKKADASAEKVQLTAQLVSENEEVRSRKEAEMKLLNAEIESNASKIFALEEKCRYLNEIRKGLTDEVSHLKKAALEELNEKRKSKWRDFKWLYPAAATIFVVVSLAYAARAR
ncbi:hypothetical protein KSP39_PZI006987 [Platanthera zijinensis]|uniref:Uncharacterized protein n=1 Tax=Platanthera zijinensis TaxID=2320716 RepID=A0AAP0G9T8_9ASPA